MLCMHAGSACAAVSCRATNIAWQHVQPFIRKPAVTPPAHTALLLHAGDINKPLYLQTAKGQTSGHCLERARTPVGLSHCCHHNMLPGLLLMSR